MSMSGQRKFPLWYVDWIRAHAAEYTTKEMAAISEQETGIAVDYKQVLNLKKNNHIASIKVDHRKNVFRLFTDDQEEWIGSVQQGKSNAELAAMIRERYGIEVTAKQISNWKKRHHLKSGLTGYFYSKENPVKDPHFMRGRPCTSNAKYKKGNRPHNAVPVGTEVKKDAEYWWVKIAEPNQWRQKHILIWEAAHGPVPAGHCLKFLDGNRDNVCLENLQLISKRVNNVMNYHHLSFPEAEMTKTGIMLAQVTVKAEERRKEMKEK